MFIDEEGERFGDDRTAWGRRAGGRHAERFRKHLQAAGVDRSALHEQSAERMRVRLHDLRATFVTIALANGKSETWVADRSGHKSSIMINRYRRQARTAGELGLGELAPLDVAIPELGARAGAVKGGGTKRRRKGRRKPGEGRVKRRMRRRAASRIAYDSRLGGSAQESNLPRTAELPRTDFEVD